MAPDFVSEQRIHTEGEGVMPKRCSRKGLWLLSASSEGGAPRGKKPSGMGGSIERENEKEF